MKSTKEFNQNRLNKQSEVKQTIKSDNHDSYVRLFNFTNVPELFNWYNFGYKFKRPGFEHMYRATAATA